MTNLRRVLAIVCVAALAGPASAHDAWLVRLPSGEFSVRYGHNDDTVAFAPEKVKSVRAFDARGMPLTVTLRPNADGMSAVVARGTPALLTLDFDNGYWSRTAQGDTWRNVPMTENPGATTGERSLKTGKTVLVWNPAVTRPRGLQLEIVPQQATAPRAGSLLPVQVLWDGKPLAGAKLGGSGHDGSNRIVADDAGRASVPVGAGWQIVTVSLNQPRDGDPGANRLYFATNLYFSAQ